MDKALLIAALNKWTHIFAARSGHKSPTRSIFDSWEISANQESKIDSMELGGLIMPVKQVIVWRNDLSCRLGKKLAQAGHAADAEFKGLIEKNMDDEGNVSFKLTAVQMEWIRTNYRKIVLRVDSEADLLLIYRTAKEKNLPVELITDLGLTEFKTATKTCLAIGPDLDEKIDEVTGEKGPLGKLKTL